MLRFVALVLLLLVPTLAAASDWTVERVRGKVVYSTGGDWAPLTIGSVVENGAYIETGLNGRVDLVRAKDHVSLGAATKVQVQDAGPKLMTTIVQWTGTVAVDVEHRNVRNFAVQTPFLAAVVKGTRFVVTAGPRSAEVSVSRGVVRVEDSATGTVADVAAGHKAKAGKGLPLKVDGVTAKPAAKSVAPKAGHASPKASSTGIEASTLKSGNGDNKGQSDTKGESQDNNSVGTDHSGGNNGEDD